MKDCELIRDLMPLYADGQLSDVSRQHVDAHTAHCPACKKLLDEMCAPMEPEPEDRTEQILEMLRRKQRRKTLLTLTAVVLAAVIAVWGFLEIRYSGELLYAASTNEEKILKEMPGVALTDAEKALAKTILEVPMIRDALRDDLSDSTTLNTADARTQFTSILPADAKIFEIFVLGRSVYFSYAVGNVYTCITYSDADMTGYIDTIGKIVAVSPLDEIGDDGVLGDVAATYELYYDVATDIARYQKIKSRHNWFSFLDWF